MIAWLLIMILAVALGILISLLYAKVNVDEKGDEIVYLRVQNRYLCHQVAMWQAKALIAENALRESQGRHHRALKENGHDQKGTPRSQSRQTLE
jgi:predicted outer membrane lipoprotein